MKKTILALCLAVLPVAAGCGYAGAFALFGDYYSEGGHTRDQKQAHFDNQVRQYERPWDDR